VFDVEFDSFLDQLEIELRVLAAEQVVTDDEGMVVGEFCRRVELERYLLGMRSWPRETRIAGWRRGLSF
jgi:hypothetical protein